MSPGPEQPRRQGPRPPRPSEAAASVGGRRPGRRAVRPLLQNPPEWRGGAAHPHPLVPAGGGGAGGEARALPVGQEGRAGAHVHQHQQRALHPPGRVHLGRQGRQLLRVPAEAVDPGREDGDAVRPAPLPRGPSARAGHGGLPRLGLGASVGGLSPHGLRAEAGPGRTPGRRVVRARRARVFLGAQHPAEGGQPGRSGPPLLSTLPLSPHAVLGSSAAAHGPAWNRQTSPREGAGSAPG